MSVSSDSRIDSPESILGRAGVDVPDRGHALLCGQFAAALFDDVRERLELSPADRTLAVIAGLFHDAGYLRGGDHHRKSFDIIRDARIADVADDDRLIAACAARYHGRSMPNIEHAGFGEMSVEDQRRTRRLSAIVRVAVAADASHRSVVKSLAARPDGDGLAIVVRASEEPAVERDRLREASGGFAALTYVPCRVEIVVEHER